MVSYKIYCIKNDCNNKKYVGQTYKDIEQRFYEHMRDKAYKCIKLCHAKEKYGIDNFYVELIAETSSLDLANYLEEYYIAEFDCLKNGYNIRKGGNYGGKLGEETKKKISEIQKGKHHSPKTEIKKGQHICLTTEIKPGEHRGRLTEFKKGVRNCPEYEFKKLFTTEQELALIEDYNAGFTWKNLAKKHNCSEKTISLILIRHNIPRKRSKRIY